VVEFNENQGEGETMNEEGKEVVPGMEAPMESDKKRDVKKEFKWAPGNYKMLSHQKLEEEKAPVK
jgi:hypothetical protein